MPGARRYTDEDIATIKAARGRLTAAEVAEKLGRPESAVYQMGHALGVTFKPKPSGSLELAQRGAFVIPKEELERYQEIVARLGSRLGLHSKSAVFLRALEIADRCLEEEEQDDTL